MPELTALIKTIISTKGVLDCTTFTLQDQSSYSFGSHVPPMTERLDTIIFWKVLVC